MIKRIKNAEWFKPVLKHLRKIKLKSNLFFKDYYGGKNNKKQFFAGRMATDDLSVDDILGICYYLVMSNGVRKSAEKHRNIQIYEELSKILNQSHFSGIDVLDIGASVGIDAVNFTNIIGPLCKINSYTLGDLYTEILVDEEGKLVYDQDGKLLQIDFGSYYYSVNFRFYSKLRKILHFSAMIKAEFYKQKFKYDLTKKYTRVSILLPELKADDNNSIYKNVRMNVFEPLVGSYDVILCLQLLMDTYFSNLEIEKAIRNLKDALRPGGILVTGDFQNYKIFINQ